MNDTIYFSTQDLFDNESIELTYSKDQIQYWVSYIQYWDKKSLHMANDIINLKKEIAPYINMPEFQSDANELGQKEVQFVNFMRTLNEYLNEVTDDEISAEFPDYLCDLLEPENSVFQLLSWFKNSYSNDARKFLYFAEQYEPIHTQMINDCRKFAEWHKLKTGRGIKVA